MTAAAENHDAAGGKTPRKLNGAKHPKMPKAGSAPEATEPKAPGKAIAHAEIDPGARDLLVDEAGAMMIRDTKTVPEYVIDQCVKALDWYATDYRGVVTGKKDYP